MLTGLVPQTHYRSVLRILRHLRLDTPLTAKLRAVAEGTASSRRLADLPWRDMVIGFGVAAKRVSNLPTREVCLRFYVKSKIPNKNLKSSWRVPKEIHLVTPGAPTVIRTDVVELRSLPRAQRTVAAGDSIGHVTGKKGAAGLAVTDASGVRLLLTCAHVAAPAGAVAGQMIESPPDRDGLEGPGAFGRLLRFTSFNEAGPNFVDAALIEPNPGVTFNNAPLDLGPAPRLTDLTIQQFASLRQHAVVRFGAIVPTSPDTVRGSRTGVIDSVENDLPIVIDDRILNFSEIVRYETQSVAGDSGGAVISLADRTVLGLHFASDGDFGYFISGRKIARLFGIKATA